MALMICPDCGRECSTSAATCPNCGRPINRQRVQEGFLHKVGKFIFGFVVAAIVVMSCVMCKMCDQSPQSMVATFPSSTPLPNPSIASTPRLDDSGNAAPQNQNSLTPLTRIRDPLNQEKEDPKLGKIRQEAYKVGLQSGRNRPIYITEDTEVKNIAQVLILAETAADLVYKPKPEHRQLWIGGFTQGFIKGYNGRRPNTPIRNMVGEPVDEAHQ